MNFKFGTAINCIDGRTHEPLIDYMKQRYGIDGVDMVTFPGADGIFSNTERSEEVELIRKAVSISVEKHGSRVVAVVGHYDCAGNPGDKQHHYSHILKAVGKVYSWNFPVQVVGFYLNDKRQIEEVK
ncbi:MAG TPA: carbonic anhydrase [Nitrososphaera sp.]|nr:carbonic anhydrase [Nitrososphaera sp.]